MLSEKPPLNSENDREKQLDVKALVNKFEAAADGDTRKRKNENNVSAPALTRKDIEEASDAMFKKAKEIIVRLGDLLVEADDRNYERIVRLRKKSKTVSEDITGRIDKLEETVNLHYKASLGKLEKTIEKWNEILKVFEEYNTKQSEKKDNGNKRPRNSGSLWWWGGKKR